MSMHSQEFQGRNPFTAGGVLLGGGVALALLMAALKAPPSYWVSTLALYVALFVYILCSEWQHVVRVDRSANSILASRRRRVGSDETMRYAINDVVRVAAKCVDTDGVYTAIVEMRDGAIYEISSLKGREDQAAAVAQTFLTATGRTDLSVTSDSLPSQQQQVS